jgi:hypothetical protein
MYDKTFSQSFLDVTGRRVLYIMGKMQYDKYIFITIQIHIAYVLCVELGKKGFFVSNVLTFD